MFKYVWLVMIVLVFVAFVSYTVYCCIQESKDADSLEEWYEYMEIEHEGVVVTWAAIFILTVAILFVSSLIVFSSSFG